MKIHQHISSIHACLISYGLAHILVDYIHINSNVCMPIAKPNMVLFVEGIIRTAIIKELQIYTFLKSCILNKIAAHLIYSN